VLVNGSQVVVGRVDGQLHAIGGVCTHQYADLENGTLDGATVFCRFHGSGFDIKTGTVVCPPATMSIKSYTVAIESGRILVDGLLAEVPIGYSGL
jgi:nitrite reductase/ring-hydroxylating ferredoxin subunit